MKLVNWKCMKKYLSFFLSVIPCGYFESKLFKAVSICIESLIFDDCQLIFEDLRIGLWFRVFVKKLPISKLQWQGFEEILGFNQALSLFDAEPDGRFEKFSKITMYITINKAGCLEFEKFKMIFGHGFDGFADIDYEIGTLLKVESIDFEFQIF